MYIITFSLYSDPFHIFFYQGSSATADVHEDIVLRFAHAGFNSGFVDDFHDGNQFYVHFADRYYYDQPSFEYHFKTNTPFPYHAELHINRTRFDYEGEYSISYNYNYLLRPNFVIDVNSKLCIIMSVVNQNDVYRILLQCFLQLKNLCGEAKFDTL